MIKSRILTLLWQKTGLAIAILSSLLLLCGCVIVSLSNGFVAFAFALILPFLFVLNLILLVFWLIKKNRFSFLFLSSIFLYFLCFDSFVQFNSFEPSDSLNKLVDFSILSYNANGFKNDGNRGLSEGQDEIGNFINNIKPDIICFQEFSAIKYKLFKDYPYWFKTNLVTSGKSVMAMFSQYPIESNGYIDFPGSTNQAIYADISINSKMLRVYNIHLESYKMSVASAYLNIAGIKRLSERVDNVHRMQEEQAQIILNHANSFKGEVIFAGDFNTTQFSKTYKNLKQNKKDTFMESGFGFGGTYPRANYPFRIDYVLVDKTIKVLSHENFNLKLSDHEPILVKLAIE